MGGAQPKDAPWVDKEAVRFEQAWKEIPRPQIEDYLADLTEPRRGLLLEELVRVERQLRQRAGEAPSPAEYHDRFPDDAAAVDAALGPAPTDGAGAESVPGDASLLFVEGPGTVIAGRYKLLEKIGEGGMGTVWLAQQTQPVRRDVALKLIKPGMDSRQILARFDAERQALAIMDHPNIARVLDAGQTDSGRPFFVMELVNGTAITTYCDERRLTPRQRLELFVPVCQAIQQAHQKGVIHRDIKPSNILVALFDDHPVPKVIDFGVAKATESPLTDHSLDTGFGALVGTPEYMSPEQATLNNLDIDTRSDVYALGVVLYELLTGTTPVDRKGLGPAAILEVLRIVREVEAPRPSTRLSMLEALPSIAACRSVEPARLAGLLRRELDWVVMKALEKDRDLRYHSANELALDVQRYLADEVVGARPPSAGYRLRKFARKHRAALTAASLFAAVLAAATVISTWHAIRANQALTRVQEEQEKTKAALAAKSEALAETKEQRERAEAREQLAIEAVKRFRDAVATNRELKNHPELDALRKELLKEPLEFFRKLRDQLQANRETRPETLAKLAIANHQLAKTTAEIGSIAAAVRSHAESITILERLVHENPTVTKYQYDLAASHLDNSTLLSKMDRAAEGLEQCQLALTIYKRLAREHPTVADYQRHLAGSYSNVGILRNETGHAVEALEAHRLALAIRERQARENPTVIAYQSDLAASHNNIGALQNETGQTVEALEAHRLALAIRERLARENPTVIAYQSDLAASHNNVGEQLRRTGHVAEALEAHRLALGIYKRLAREHPTVIDYQHDLAVSYNNIGIAQAETGHPAEAVEAFRLALTIRERLAREHPTVAAYQRDLAVSLHNAFNPFKETGRAADALVVFRLALTIREQLARDHPTVIAYQSDVAASHDYIGERLRDNGHAAEALEAFRLALTIREQLAREHPTVIAYQRYLAVSYNNIGILQAETGRAAEAQETFRLALTIHETLVQEPSPSPDNQSELARTLSNLATLDMDQGRWLQAKRRLERATEHQRKAVAAIPRHPLYRRFLSLQLLKLTQVHMELNQPTEAVRLARGRAVLMRGSPTDLYDVACDLASIVLLVPGDQKQTLAAEAVQRLKEAIDAGWDDAAQMSRESDLDPLRDRDDFRRLLAEPFDRGFPSDPFAP